MKPTFWLTLLPPSVHWSTGHVKTKGGCESNSFEQTILL